MTALDCVVDASVAVKLHLVEPLSAEAHALFALLNDPATVFHVPDLFFVECANILWKQVQRGVATAAQVGSHHAALRCLRLQRTATYDLTPDALPLALTHTITAYDACYVVLAQRLGVPLITADDQLVRQLGPSFVNVVHLRAWIPPGTKP